MAEPFGYYWAIVHASTGEVVNSGFTLHIEGEEPEAANERPHGIIRGIVVRTTPLYVGAPVMRAAGIRKRTSAGGKAAAAKLDAAGRIERARKAATARWDKARRKDHATAYQ